MFSPSFFFFTSINICQVVFKIVCLASSLQIFLRVYAGFTHISLLLNENIEIMNEYRISGFFFFTWTNKQKVTCRGVSVLNVHGIQPVCLRFNGEKKQDWVEK